MVPAPMTRSMQRLNAWQGPKETDVNDSGGEEKLLILGPRPEQLPLQV